MSGELVRDEIIIEEALGGELVREKGFEKYVCDADIERCATLDSFPEGSPPAASTALIMIGMVFIWDFAAPIIWYWVRMSIRRKTTGQWTATNAVDISTAVLWISHLVFYIFGFVLWPFGYLHNDKVDFVLAYSLVAIYADGIAAMTIIFWLLYFFVALWSGSNEENVCRAVTGTDVAVCYYNASYTSKTDGWLSFLFYTIGAAGQYFLIFWYGADAVRWLRPNGGYDLYYLYPTQIYNLMVIFGQAPDASRRLTGHELVFGDNETIIVVDEEGNVLGDEAENFAEDADSVEADF